MNDERRPTLFAGAIGSASSKFEAESLWVGPGAECGSDGGMALKKESPTSPSGPSSSAASLGVVAVPPGPAVGAHRPSSSPGRPVANAAIAATNETVRTRRTSGRRAWSSALLGACGFRTHTDRNVADVASASSDRVASYARVHEAGHWTSQLSSAQWSSSSHCV